MTKKIQNILLVYKNSAYKNYFINKSSMLFGRRKFVPPENLKRFADVHRVHYATLRVVEQELKECGLKYEKCRSGEKRNYSKFDLIITVGGDGTFLESARNIKSQLILGVNSAPKWSVGKFCVASAGTFSFILKRIITGKYKVVALNRLILDGYKTCAGVNILNDILIAHRNPAAMSRYAIYLKGVREEQRSSGVWISTAAGSTGAIRSAGGKILPSQSKECQYKPRELFYGFREGYRLRGGLFSAKEKIKVVSLMREGMIFADGARVKWEFPFGSVITVKSSPYVLRTVKLR
jgi:NAD+ kinase